MQKRKTEEVSNLRRRNEVLEDELRRYRIAIDGKEGVIVAKLSHSAENVLDVLKSKGRGVTQNFKMSTWDHKRKESQANSSLGSEILSDAEAIAATDASSNLLEMQTQNEMTTALLPHESKPNCIQKTKVLVDRRARICYFS